MRRYFLLLSIIFSCIKLHAQEYNIKTIDKTSADYYSWITFLSEGDTEWNGDNGGNAYRIAITTSEIYDDIHIEKISMGDEGAGKKVVWKRKVDREDLVKVFGIHGELSGIEFVKWKFWDSIELKIQNRKFIFKNLGSDIVKVEELK